MGRGKKVLAKKGEKRASGAIKHEVRDGLADHRVAGRSTLANAGGSRDRRLGKSDSAVRPTVDAPILRGNAQQPTDARRAAEARIDGLKDLAVEEDIKVSAASENDLWAFLDSVSPSQRPYIALLDNGNFRAVWKNAEQEQVGLQFLGDGEVQYALFALRPPNRFMARSAGRDALTHIERWIEGYGLSRLMAA